LEPLYNDYRKIRIRTVNGTFILNYVDEIIDDFFRKDMVFDTILPRIQYRYSMEKYGTLDNRLTVLEHDFEEAVREEKAAVR